jgi:hypothetical protein
MTANTHGNLFFARFGIARQLLGLAGKGRSGDNEN